MPLLWIAVVLVLAKWLEVGPTAAWSWWVVLTPSMAVVIWFEWLEPVFGRDRRTVESDRLEVARKERLAQQFDLRKPR